MSERKLELGIIGIGVAAEWFHIPGIGKSFRLAAAADTRSKELPPGVTFFTDYHDLLKDTDIVAVDIATPPDTHNKITLDCLNAGKHVLVEKPPALTMEQLVEMENLARTNKLSLFTAFHTSYRPEVVAAEELLRGVKIRKITLRRFENVDDYHKREEWIFNPKIGGGGVLMDSGINVLAQLRRILPNIFPLEVIEANLSRPEEVEVETHANVKFKFGQNSLGTLEMEWLHKGDQVGEMVFETKENTYTVNIVTGQLFKDKQVLVGGKNITMGRVTTESVIREYALLYQDFARYIKQGKSFVSKGELQFVLDAYKMAGFYCSS